MRALFICKKNSTYGFTTYTRRSSGLFNSTRFITEAMAARGIHAHIVEVGDNNEIDREVTAFKPNIVVIEALWVVPNKFPILRKLHPMVKWYVHLHSHIPFLALEGIAMEWIDEYLEHKIGVIANSIPAFKALSAIVRHPGLIYLPNVYLAKSECPPPHQMTSTVNVGCFGAVRPLKNQLLQAMAAIRFARERGQKLRFHINASRIETMGQPVMKNMLELFARTKDTSLVQHAWHEPEEFIRQLRMKMDIGLQVSLTETFNVVAADYVTAGIPVVGSKEIPWLSKCSQAQDDSIDDIVDRMHFAMRHRMLINWNRRLLRRYSERAQNAWFKFLHGEHK